MTHYLLLAAVGTLAGLLNVVGGGGSMLSLPVLIFVGLPPTIANGTNRVAILVQNVVASWGFHQHRKIDLRWLRAALPSTLAGAVAGAWTGSVLGDLQFQRVLAVAMLVVAVWMVWSPVKPALPGRDHGPPESAGGRIALALAWLGVGFYGGLIQAGLGFVILAVTSAAGLDLVRGNALKVSLVLLFSPLVLGIYAWSGLVDWPSGVALASGAMIGARLGVHLTVLKGQAWLTRVVTVLVVVFAVRLWFAD